MNLSKKEKGSVRVCGFVGGIVYMYFYNESMENIFMTKTKMMWA